MTNKQAYRADGGDIGTDRIKEIASNVYGDEEKCWLAKRVLALLDELEAKDKRIAELEAREVTPLMFIDGDISPDDAEKLAAIIRDFNEETETPAARMARIIRENPHPTNMCDMPSTDRINGEG